MSLKLVSHGVARQRATLFSSEVGAYGFDNSQVMAGWLTDTRSLMPFLQSWYSNSSDGDSCQNYDCVAFVQYDGSRFLGTPLSPVSVPGGAQGEVTMGWLWVDGNWWLQVNGTWVGYYPGVLFAGTDMATHADYISLGGTANGYGYVPQMGSGRLGASGYPYAAYHRRIFYYDGAYNTYWATGLSYPPINNCPAITSTIGPYFDTVGDWGVYFFFGGPGGLYQ